MPLDLDFVELKIQAFFVKELVNVFQELGWSGFILKRYFYKNGKVNRIITTDETVKNLSINL